MNKEYKNLWSNNAEAAVFDHKTIINYIVDIKYHHYVSKIN